LPFDEDARAVPMEVLFSELSHEKRRELMAEALNRLPARFREVLFLFEIERWSYKAIAAALNVRLETVMLRLKDARRRMQQELTQIREREIEDPAETAWRCSASMSAAHRKKTHHLQGETHA
jgi:DNA-directed RNA polymerase specialized sigma24 family protein